MAEVVTMKNQIGRSSFEKRYPVRSRCAETTDLPFFGRRADTSDGATPDASSFGNLPQGIEPIVAFIDKAADHNKVGEGWNILRTLRRAIASCNVEEINAVLGGFNDAALARRVMLDFCFDVQCLGMRASFNIERNRLTAQTEYRLNLRYLPDGITLNFSSVEDPTIFDPALKKMSSGSENSGEFYSYQYLLRERNITRLNNLARRKRSLDQIDHEFSSDASGSEFCKTAEQEIFDGTPASLLVRELQQSLTNANADLITKVLRSFSSPGQANRVIEHLRMNLRGCGIQISIDVKGSDEQQDEEYSLCIVEGGVEVHFSSLNPAFGVVKRTGRVVKQCESPGLFQIYLGSIAQCIGHNLPRTTVGQLSDTLGATKNATSVLALLEGTSVDEEPISSDSILEIQCSGAIPSVVSSNEVETIGDHPRSCSPEQSNIERDPGASGPDSPSRQPDAIESLRTFLESHVMMFLSEPQRPSLTATNKEYNMNVSRIRKISIYSAAALAVIATPLYMTLSGQGKDQVEISYSLELKRQGRTKIVSNDTNFLPGDKVRIHVNSNVSGNARIVLMSRNGKPSVTLFPTNGDESNTLSADEEIVVPRCSDDAAATGAKGWLKFGDKAGTDRVRVTFIPRDNDLNDDDTSSASGKKVRFEIPLRHESFGVTAGLWE